MNVSTGIRCFLFAEADFLQIFFLVLLLIWHLKHESRYIYLMIRFLVLCFLVAFFSAATRSNLRAQSQSLFDDKKLSSVYIEMDPDSVIWLYQNVLSTKYLKADFIFRDGQFSDTVRNVGFRLRGNTSRYAQKKSFKVSFNTFVSGRKYQG
ncbi:MAG TPA: hypothetical protein PKY12_06640, partial [Catalimonadaceae bacterium]|nr:hypothetical protein [Catalimonadaceae bacterium]